jgi:homoserine dehydrogenase
VRLAILGAGAVGTSVAELASTYDHEVTALADSTSAVVDDDGVDVASALERKQTEGHVGGPPRRTPSTRPTTC